MDTTTPAGRMVFTVLGAVAELERSLIVERVRTGLRNARAKGKMLGRPRKVVDAGRITALRAQGLSMRAIASELGIGLVTLHRTPVPVPKLGEGNLERDSRSLGLIGPVSDKILGHNR
jgi:DNA invertase Pin-like site-specific DNA recombinase